MYPCFLIEPTAEVRQSVIAMEYGCAVAVAQGGSRGYHRAEITIRVDLQNTKEATITITDTDVDMANIPEFLKCDKCGHDISTKGAGKSAGHLWKRADTGEVRDRIQDFGVGAMWRADWYRSENGLYGHDWENATEAPLIVRTPGGDWNIDARCSNCTRPEDKLHRCWVRHGEPPNVHVNKDGNTCSAGAGSIIVGNYHGFLHNGQLTAGC